MNRVNSKKVVELRDQKKMRWIDIKRQMLEEDGVEVSVGNLYNYYKRYKAQQERDANQAETLQAQTRDLIEVYLRTGKKQKTADICNSTTHILNGCLLNLDLVRELKGNLIGEIKECVDKGVGPDDQFNSLRYKTINGADVEITTSQYGWFYEQAVSGQTKLSLIPGKGEA